MKRLLGFQSLFLPVIFIGIISFSVSTAFAQMSEEQYSPSYYPDAPIPVLPEQPEAWMVSGHPVGDSIGRGLDFVLRPVYNAGSWVWLSVFEPSGPYHITQLKMTGCPEEPEPVSKPETAAPAQPEEEQTPQAQPQDEQAAPLAQ
jgi:hypothetical protein